MDNLLLRLLNIIIESVDLNLLFLIIVKAICPLGVIITGLPYTSDIDDISTTFFQTYDFTCASPVTPVSVSHHEFPLDGNVQQSKEEKRNRESFLPRPPRSKCSAIQPARGGRSEPDKLPEIGE